MKCLVGCAALLLAACGSQPQSAPRSTVIQLDTQEVVYRPGPTTMPPGVELAVLEGNPAQAGLFTVRLRVPAGFVLEPHTHPQDERVTVIEGTVVVGFGPVLQPEKARTLGAGAYYLNPPGVVHYVLSPQGATIQITGQGPWRVDFHKAAVH